MSISNNYVPVRQLGNGVTTQFSSNWAMLAAAYAAVFLEDANTGVQVEQVLGSDYTLVFDGSGFTVTFTLAPAVTKYVVIGRAVSLDQTDPYRTSKGFQGEVIEASFDKLTAINQDLSEALTRSLKFPLGSTADGALPAPIDDNLIAWDGVTGAMKNAGSATAIQNSATSAAASAASASASASSATSAAATASAAATTAAGYGAALSGTSATSNAIGLGAKTFTVAAAKSWTAGQYLVIADQANSANYLHGSVTSYSGTSLVMNIVDVGGSGTKTAWNISVSGTQGPQGATGSPGSILWAVAGGTADALTFNFAGAVGSLTDGLLITGRAAAANATTTPTAQADSTTAHVITKKGGTALAAGDIPGGLSEILLRYNLANTRWELLNPATGASGGTAVVSVKKQTFSGSGTYTPTANMLYCVAELVGAGGGGGASNGKGGGGGEYRKGLFTAADIGASKTVTIGAGGAGGTGSSDGSAGGATSLGALLVGSGGAAGTHLGIGGEYRGVAGGTGGSGTGLSIPGSDSTNTTGAGSGGGGGNSHWGNGAQPSYTASVANSPSGYGAGGGGATGAANGTAGTDGYMYITEFCST